VTKTGEQNAITNAPRTRKNAALTGEADPLDKKTKYYMDITNQFLHGQREIRAICTNKNKCCVDKKKHVVFGQDSAVRKKFRCKENRRAHIDTLCTGSEARTCEVFTTLTGFVLGETLPSEPQSKQVQRSLRDRVHEPLHVGNAETEAHRKMIQLLPHLFLLPEGAVLGKIFLDAVRPPVDEGIWVLRRVLDDFPAAVVLVHA
jgi:hypothetical protein